MLRTSVSKSVSNESSIIFIINSTSRSVPGFLWSCCVIGNIRPIESFIAVIVSVCVRVCVCVCVCVYVNGKMCMYVCVCVGARSRVHMRTYAWMCSINKRFFPLICMVSVVVGFLELNCSRIICDVFALLIVSSFGYLLFHLPHTSRWCVPLLLPV